MKSNDLSWESEGPDSVPQPANVETRRDVDEREVAAFIGPTTRYYVDQFVPVLRSGRGGISFNWAAFFLTGLWLGYRKMYVHAAVFYAILIPATVIGMAEGGWDEPPSAVSSFIGLVAALVCGVYGNRWYLQRVGRALEASRAQKAGAEDTLQQLARRGGTSVIGSFAMLALFVGICLVVEFLGSLEFRMF